MKADSKQLATILVDQTHGASESTTKDNVKKFVTFLAQHNLLDQWREIEASIHNVWKEKYGASVISVTSAHEITDETRKALDTIASGAEIKERVDDRLIGGAVIRIDDKRIDGSITGKLRRLKMELSN
jgi:F-type H+-transporting ATPase subunit delta